MQEAVGRFVPDGASVCMGTALEALIPFAAGHELIRQRRRDPTLVGPISDILFDPLVTAGCVRRIQAAWVGNVSAGFGHNDHEETRTVDGARAWLDHWVLGVADSKGFLSTLGPEARKAVRVKTPRPSEPLDYGAGAHEDHSC